MVYHRFYQQIVVAKKGFRPRDWCQLGMAMRMLKYAVHADYAQIREDVNADASENLIHIIHI